MTNQVEAVQKLKEEHERLWLALHASQLGQWEWDMQSGVVECDDRWAGMLGYQKSDLTPFTMNKFLAMCHPEDQKTFSAAIASHVEGRREFFQVSVRLENKSGAWGLVKSTGMIVRRSAKGEALLMTGVHENISDLAPQQNQTDVVRDNLEAAQRLAGLGSWYLDLSSNQMSWSEELFKMHGLNPASKAPAYSEHHNLFSPESWQLLKAALDQIVATGEPYSLELEMFTEGISHGFIAARGEAVRGLDGKIVGVLGVAQDITTRKTKETELRRRALRDPLTQLGNRTSFEIGIAQALKQGRQIGGTFAVVMVDIDRFKEVNDQFGHEVGDRALVALADRLRATLRDDDQIFRVGGDEFIIILPKSISPAKSAEIAHRIVNAFRAPLLQLEEPLTVFVSAGMVIWDNRESSDELIRRADEALYSAKAGGRNRLFTAEL